MATTNPEPGQLFLFNTPVENTPVLSKEIRDNFTAVARSNFTTDANFPLNPRPGMRRINAGDPNNVKDQVWLEGSGGGGGAWQTVNQRIQLGVPAPIKLIVNITTPPLVNSWTIDHNLGSQPIVQAFNSAWFQFRVVPQFVAPGVNECSIQQVTPNRVVVTFQAATFPTGFVVLVG